MGDNYPDCSFRNSVFDERYDAVVFYKVQAEENDFEKKGSGTTKRIWIQRGLEIVK